jgi:uncharacterized membrane protein
MKVLYALKVFWSVSRLRKLVVVLVAIGIVITVGSLTLYFVTFHGGLSPNDSAWGNLGGFLSGVLGPLYSLFAFVGVLYTLYVQNQQGQENRQRDRIVQDNANNQLEIMRQTLLETRKQSQIQELQAIVHNYLNDIQVKEKEFIDAYKYVKEGGLSLAGADSPATRLSPVFFMAKRINAICGFLQELSKYERTFYYRNFVKHQLDGFALMVQELNSEALDSQSKMFFYSPS